MSEEKKIDKPQTANENMACNLVLAEVKLSSLQNGQSFKFKSGQVAKYMMKGSSYLRDMETNEHTLYRVKKKNEMSVKCETEFGTMEYTFKFKGLTGYTVKDLTNYTGVDCSVMII